MMTNVLKGLRMRIRNWLSRGHAVEVGAFLLTLLVASLFCPFPGQPSNIPAANGKAAGLAAVLQPAQVILAGNERYLAAAEYQDLSEKLGVPVAKITARQAGPAWIYLLIKNIAPQGSILVIPFSGAQLTFSELYADSGRDDLAYLMSGREPEVERLTYLGRLPEQEYWLRRVLPFYAWREEAGKQAERFLDQQTGALFFPDAADPGQRQLREAAHNQAIVAHDKRIWDFRQQYATGYLPRILNTAQQKKIRLIWLELPGLQAADPALGRRYQELLQQTLERAGGTVLRASRPGDVPVLVQAALARNPF